jgi:energy-coupling factor transporter ATP-binding protein EcfA2
MRFRDRPLLVDGLDAGLYLDRPELERRVVEPLLSDRNVLLLGDAGSGKSTVLRQAASVLRSRGRDAVLVNGALARDATQLLELVDDAMPDGSDRPPQRPGSSGLLNAARRLQRPSPVAILLDGLSEAEIGYDLFGRLRDELWELGHPWGVAVRPRDSGALRSPPADAFWSDIVEICPLDHDQTERLLRLGLDEEEYQTVQRCHSIAGTHPRSVIREAQRLLAGDPDSSASPGTELLERASAVGRSEAMAMAELQGIGRPVSAHDPELLARLGWSRSYAQRILSRLEANGLLRTMPERGDRIGRPRKLYEARPRRDS